MITKRQEDFLRVLQQSLGVVGLALQQTNVSRDEYDEWLEDMEFEQKIKEIDDLSLDYVENQLLKLIQQGELSAITYYLKTKGKKRGY
jgi:hypothetical protein